MKYLGKIVAMDVSWKIFLGFFIAIVALVTVSISILLTFVEAFRSRLFEIVLGIAIIGLVLLVSGYFKNRGTENAAGEEAKRAPIDGSEHPLAFFRKFEFWGSILLLGALPIYFLTRMANQPIQNMAKPKVVAQRPPELPRTPERPPPPKPQFPSMNLQGFIYNGDHSTAVINGRTVVKGAMFDDLVTVLSIDREGVTVEMLGERKILRLQE